MRLRSQWFGQALTMPGFLREKDKLIGESDLVWSDILPSWRTPLEVAGMHYIALATLTGWVIIMNSVFPRLYYKHVRADSNGWAGGARRTEEGSLVFAAGLFKAEGNYVVLRCCSQCQAPESRLNLINPVTSDSLSGFTMLDICHTSPADLAGRGVGWELWLSLLSDVPSVQLWIKTVSGYMVSNKCSLPTRSHIRHAMKQAQ